MAQGRPPSAWLETNDERQAFPGLKVLAIVSAIKQHEDSLVSAAVLMARQFKHLTLVLG
jgi:hypothetical protein